MCVRIPVVFFVQTRTSFSAHPRTVCFTDGTVCTRSLPPQHDTSTVAKYVCVPGTRQECNKSARTAVTRHTLHCPQIAAFRASIVAQNLIDMSSTDASLIREQLCGGMYACALTNIQHLPMSAQRMDIIENTMHEGHVLSMFMYLDIKTSAGNRSHMTSVESAALLRCFLRLIVRIIQDMAVRQLVLGDEPTEALECAVMGHFLPRLEAMIPDMHTSPTMDIATICDESLNDTLACDDVSAAWVYGASVQGWAAQFLSRSPTFPLVFADADSLKAEALQLVSKRVSHLRCHVLLRIRDLLKSASDIWTWSRLVSAEGLDAGLVIRSMSAPRAHPTAPPPIVTGDVVSGADVPDAAVLACPPSTPVTPPSNAPSNAPTTAPMNAAAPPVLSWAERVRLGKSD